MKCTTIPLQGNQMGEPEGNLEKAECLPPLVSQMQLWGF